MLLFKKPSPLSELGVQRDLQKVFTESQTEMRKDVSEWAEHIVWVSGCCSVDPWVLEGIGLL